MDESLSDRLVGVALRDPSPGLPRVVARSLFDFSACVVGGAAAGMPSWPADRAGQIAVCAHLGDRDDLHPGSATHPGGVVWSAVAATAAETDATLDEATRASAFGYELVVRLAESLGPDQRGRWHPTTLAGTVGAAGAAALVLGGGDERIAACAVGHALSVAGGSAQALFERTATQIVHRAHAASAGVACARAACAGLTANRLGLNVDRGAFERGASDAFEERIVATREPTAIEETGFRLYAVTGFAHAAVDAALSLGQIDPGTIAAVHVRVAPSIALTLASNPAPARDEDAWWSIEHAVAVTLGSGSPDPLEHGLSKRADQIALCRRVSVLPVGSGWAASVQVLLEDGAIAKAAVEVPRGHPSRPATDDDLRLKWRAVAGRAGVELLDVLLEADPSTPLATTLGPALREHPKARALLLGEPAGGTLTCRDRAGLGGS